LPQEALSHPAPPHDSRPGEVVFEAGYVLGKGVDAFDTGATTARAALGQLKKLGPTLLIAFASPAYDLKRLADGIRQVAGDVPLIGTTTAGEICNRASHQSVALLALASPFLAVHIGFGRAVSHDWRQAIADAVATPALRRFFSPSDRSVWEPLAREGKTAVCLVFSPGNTRYADTRSFEIAEELKRLSGGMMPFFGGGSADDWHMEQNQVVGLGEVHSDTLLLVVLETSLRVGLALEHGYRPTEARATVTAANGHEVLALDGKPAAEVFSRLLGCEKRELENKHLTLTTRKPVGFRDHFGKYSINIASYFTPRDGVRLSQPVTEGTVLTIMDPAKEELVLAGREALRKALVRGGIARPALALVFSCALRQKVLSGDLDEELAPLMDMAGGAPVVGFYSFGEQGLADDGVVRHNNGVISVLALGAELSPSAVIARQNADLRRLQRALVSDVERRARIEAELQKVTRNLRNLFDHMRQAIVAFDSEGRIRGAVSRQANVIFDRDDLEGSSIRDLLYKNLLPGNVEPAHFDEWRQMAFATPADEWSTCEAYAPSEAVFARADGMVVPLRLEFRPLVSEGKVVQIMLLCTDVSVERKLEKAVQTKEAEHSQRLAAMRKLIAGGTQVFIAFVDSARRHLDRCKEILAVHREQLPIAAIDELFRQVHTVRGEARAFDLTELEAEAKKLEECFNQLRDEARGGGHVLGEPMRSRLVEGLELARKGVERGCQLLVAASPAGSAVLDQVMVQRDVLCELVSYAGARTDRLGELVARLTAVPFGVTAAAVVESAAGWAAAAGNAVEVSVRGRERMLPAPLARVLPSVLAHLVRNAIAHGIEPGPARRLAGKPESGSIVLAAEIGAAGPYIVIEDDGRGLDVVQLHQRAKAIGAAGGDVGSAELAFLPGVTTRSATDELAGRGVGLDAVRAELAQIDYDVRVTFAPGRFTRFALAPRETGTIE
jgi:PAS domain-containing protein